MDPFDPAKELQRAILLLRGDRWEEAAGRLKELLWQDPSNALAYAALGLALVHQGDTAGAVRALERAHFLAPDDPHLLHQYGLALQAAGRAEEAHLRFEGVLKLEAKRGTPFEKLRSEARALALPPSARAPEPGPPRPQLGQAVLEPSSPGLPAILPDPDSLLPGEEPDSLEGAPVPGARPRIRQEESEGDGGDGGAAASPVPPCPPRAEAPLLNPDEPRAGENGRLPPGAPFVAPISPDQNAASGGLSAFEETSPEGDVPFPPEPPPGFLFLVRGCLQLWIQQPLLWLGLLAVAAVPVAVLAWLTPIGGPSITLLQVAALSLAAPPTLLAMAGQWVHGRPFPPSPSPVPARLARGFLVLTPCLLVAVLPLARAFTLRVPVWSELALLAGLLLTLPFWVLLAPGLMLVLTEGSTLGSLLPLVFRIPGRRLWMHLAVMVFVGAILGGGFALLLGALAVTLRAPGGVVLPILQAASLCIGESIWGVGVAVCGIDGLAAAEAAGTDASHTGDPRGV
jgi:hypothetical protein